MSKPRDRRCNSCLKFYNRRRIDSLHRWRTWGFRRSAQFAKALGECRTSWAWNNMKFQGPHDRWRTRLKQNNTIPADEILTAGRLFTMYKIPPSAHFQGCFIWGFPSILHTWSPENIQFNPKMKLDNLTLLPVLAGSALAYQATTTASSLIFVLDYTELQHR